MNVVISIEPIYDIVIEPQYCLHDVDLISESIVS